jgi:hypothetical protein
MDSFARAIDPPDPRKESSRLRRVVRHLACLLEGRRVQVHAGSDSPAKRYNGVCGKVEAVRPADIAESGYLLYIDVECRADIAPRIVAEPHELRSAPAGGGTDG